MKAHTPNAAATKNPASNIIVGMHVDDPIGIAPTEEDLDRAEKTVEKIVELNKRGNH